METGEGVDRCLLKANQGWKDGSGLVGKARLCHLVECSNTFIPGMRPHHLSPELAERSYNLQL